MKVLVAALILFLATPVSALDIFSSKKSESSDAAKGPSLEERVQMLERRINTLSNIVLRLDSLQQEIQQLRGDIEVVNHTMESLKKRQVDLYVDLDQRISRITGEAPAGRPAEAGVTGGTVPSAEATASAPPMQPQMPASAGEPSWESSPLTPEANQTSDVAQNQQPMASAPATGMAAQTQPRDPNLPPVVSSKPRSEPAPGQLTSTSVSMVAPKPQPKPAQVSPRESKDEKSSYQKAFNLLMDRKYDQAQQSFRSFLVRYPGSRLADNAQYWLAEANYVTRNFDVALAEFNKVVQVHSSSPKVSDALLKIGYIQYEKKQWSAAKETLNNVVSSYPNSTASQLAKKRLAKMRAQGH